MKILALYILLLLLCFLVLVLVLTLSPVTVRAQSNDCQPDQVFASQAHLQFSINGGEYLPVPPQAEYYLKQFTACPITYPIAVGAYQPLSILADGDALTVRIVGNQVYVYRAWKIYPLSLQQWEHIVDVVELKFPTGSANKNKASK